MHDQGNDHASTYFRTDHHWKPNTGLWAAKQVRDVLGIRTERLDRSQFMTETYSGILLGSEGKRGGKLYCPPEDLEIPIPKFDTALMLQINDDAPRSGSFREALLFPAYFTATRYEDFFPYHAFLDGDHGRLSIRNVLYPDGMRLLILKDSNTNCLAPYLALCCSQIDLIDMRYYSGSVPEYIADMCPDAVCITMSARVKNDFFDFTSER